MSFKKETIDLVHKTINGKTATDEELYAALFPPRKGLRSGMDYHDTKLIKLKKGMSNYYDRYNKRRSL